MSCHGCPTPSTCGSNCKRIVLVWDDHRPPIVCLPLMTKPTREVEKGTKYLPEMWKPT